MKKIAQPQQAVLLELFEERAWTDMYQAAPAGFVSAFGLSYKNLQNSTLFFCSKIPFVHFNCVSTLGLQNIISNEDINRVVSEYEEKSCSKAFIITSPLTNPDSVESMLIDKGFNSGGSWDRVYRNGAALIPVLPTDRDLYTEEISEQNGKQWADFICNTYGLPTQAWLLALVGREGWHHFILKAGDKIIEVRTFYIKEAYVWIGIDAPIPGIMTQDYEADYVLMHAILERGLANGGKHFIADIEKPDKDEKLPSYEYFRELGFTVEYRRNIYSKALK